MKIVRKVRKKAFTPWQTYMFNLSFMSQGLLLLISACISSIAFFLAVSFCLSISDRIFVTIIHRGDLVTRLISPLFWLAVAFSATLAVLLIFARPLSRLFLGIYSNDLKISDERPMNIKRRIRMSVFGFYVYALAICIMWLYSAVTFSLVIRGGAIEYLFIFVSIVILTLLAKPIVVFPVYFCMKRAIDREKKHRDDTSLLVDRDEGEEPLDVGSITLSRSEYKKIYSLAEVSARKLGYEIREIEVTLGTGLDDDSLTENTKRVKLSIGAELLCILDENQLEATFTAHFVKLKNGTGKSLRHFVAFNEAIAFCTSKWSIPDRLYLPINVLLLAECNEYTNVVNSSIYKSLVRFAKKTEPSIKKHIVSAMIKKAVYIVMPFAYDKSFYHKLIRSQSPVDDYHSRLIEKYFAYVEDNTEKILDSMSKMHLTGLKIYDLPQDKLAELIKEGDLDITTKPTGDLAIECKKISAAFDRFFSLFVSPHFERKTEQLYHNKIKSVINFENCVISGKDMSTEEKITAAENYLSLMMPSASLDVLSDVPEHDKQNNARLNLILGEAKLRIGDRNGIDNLITAASLNYRYTYKALTIAERLLIVNGFAEEYTSLTDNFKPFAKKYIENSIGESKLWLMDDLTGTYRPSVRVSPCTTFSDEEKSSIANDIINICTEDRFEWAALVNVKRGDKDIPTLIVRCSQIHPGGYTDTYKDGVYFHTGDQLVRDVRLYGDMYEKPLVARLFYEAEIEAFESVEGAIISRKGKLEAERILSHELSSFIDDEDDQDYIEFHSEEENDTDTDQNKDK